MEAARREALEDRQEQLCREIPAARALLDKLRRAELKVSRAEPDEDSRSSSGKRTWFLFVQPPAALRDRFDLAPEVLLVLAPWPTAQARDITSAEHFITRDLRLDRGVVLHVSQDARARSQLSQAIEQTGRIYVMTTFEALLEAGDPQAWFRQLLVERIAQSDLFTAGRPVLGWNFVGREQELRILRGKLLAGRPVGLFGLRKVGKTSLLMCLRNQWLRDASGDEAIVHAVPIHVDLLAVSFAEPNLDGIFRLVLASMRQTMNEFGIMLPSGGHRAPADEPIRLGSRALRESVVSTFQDLLEWSSGQESRPPILLFIDEYERLFGAASMLVDEGLDFLDFLRGLVQQHPGRFNILVAGLRREPAAQSRYGKRQNPLFGFLVEDYLAGLDAKEMGELVRRVGRRLGLRFDSTALQVLWDETGGHPYLVREYGRVIDAAIPLADRRSAAKVVDAPIAGSLREQFHRSVDNTMQEIAEAIRELDPQALDVLARPEANILSPRTADLLARYGILASPDRAHPLRIGAFGAWLAHNHVGLSMVSSG